MSERDIAEQIKALYDVENSPELVSKISEKLMPEVTAWQNRALEAVYPFVFLDAIYYKVKENHQYVTKAAYEKHRKTQRTVLRVIGFSQYQTAIQSDEQFAAGKRPVPSMP